MIPFQPVQISQKPEYDGFLKHCGERGCEYSFANLFLWGRQQGAVVDGHLVLLSQYDRKTVYPYPVGQGDKKPVLDAIIRDAGKRGLLCRLTGLTPKDCEALEQMYPGRFQMHCDRDNFDYVYRVEELALLKGRKYQRKRNHVNRFYAENPDCSLQVLTPALIPAVRKMVGLWFAQRESEDFFLEQTALRKALEHWEALGMEGMVLLQGEDVLAMTMGSHMSEETVDVHFEKALVDGAYAAINQGFAKYLYEKYPRLQYLNREDDLGLEGLRKAKLSYCPDHLIGKCWAQLLEDGYAY